MKQILQALILLALVSTVYAQASEEDSVRLVLRSTTADTARVHALNELADIYFFRHPDSTLTYSTQALELSRKLNYRPGILRSLFQRSEALHAQGDIIHALAVCLEWLELSQEFGNVSEEANAIGFIGILYSDLEAYDQSASYLRKAIAMRNQLEPQPSLGLFYVYLGNLYSVTGRPDSAFLYLNKVPPTLALFPILQLKVVRDVSLGDAFLRDGNLDSAAFYYRVALKDALKQQDEMSAHLSAAMVGLVKFYNLRNKPDSSFYFAQQAFQISNEKHLNVGVYESSLLLSKLFEEKSILDSALYYQRLATATYDTIYGKRKYNELQLVVLREQQRNDEMQQLDERNRNRIIQVALISLAGVVVGASLLLLRSYGKKQKANLALNRTLTELKSTQSQLIQSEKMASLGELTAGIAHEIQNPLNFVNNFSEVNSELIDDLKKELTSGNNQLAKAIADNIKENQEKINHHGKRAEGIVKSMLQHSRTSSGHMELTDINTLCDEYLRLSYHGFRAKEKSFNAKIDTKFDASIPKVNVVPQDIGRVLLNLINNAFYAVNEKAKNKIDGFEPSVTISTKLVNARPDDPPGRGKIEISVRDNGSGIAESLKEKIFQPFFSTKPTGQGTGLGLSLSYDIVKVHGGELVVHTVEGNGSEFIIRL